ncbi:hypothetical protein BDY21DRAFT_99874 [Lineolata rhizophorae]|uniref:Meiotic recombination protein DMC1 n=1 Tax=Lineolata rhizophorae TaxID=578093 RepID=A0A6A6NT79_9PEZI|nr:hypothetical protein BDY21DRAFT_99874 [Lineolata rhizophorae]
MDIAPDAPADPVQPPPAVSPVATSPVAHSKSSPRGSLPHPRLHPLKLGGAKESALIQYADQAMLHIQRRFAKRGNLEDGSQTDVVGYHDFAEAATDMESLLDVIWVSGTASLQVPYLLSLALLAVTIIPKFPPMPRQLFELLGKLDVAFASLLRARNVETGEPLPGTSEHSRLVTTTEKVRIRNLVGRTRLCVVSVMDLGGYEEDEESEDDERDDPLTDTDDKLDGIGIEKPELDLEAMVESGGHGWEMNVAEVYKITVEELGDMMGDTPVGMISDD